MRAIYQQNEQILRTQYGQTDNSSKMQTLAQKQEGYTRKVVLEQAKAADSAARMRQEMSLANKVSNALVFSLTHLATSAIKDFLVNQVREGVEYLKEYNNLMNEIQIVTGYTDSQIES